MKGGGPGTVGTSVASGIFDPAGLAAGSIVTTRENLGGSDRSSCCQFMRTAIKSDTCGVVVSRPRVATGQPLTTYDGGATALGSVARRRRCADAAGCAEITGCEDVAGCDGGSTGRGRAHQPRGSTAECVVTTRRVQTALPLWRISYRRRSTSFNRSSTSRYRWGLCLAAGSNDRFPMLSTLPVAGPHGNRGGSRFLIVCLPHCSRS